jgi:hypothetical protein
MTRLGYVTLGVTAFAMSFASGCIKPAGGLYSSDESRIWVVRGDEVFRCADGAAPEQPPKPVCVRAPMTEPSR